jgi:hypothetical protein
MRVPKRSSVSWPADWTPSRYPPEIVQQFQDFITELHTPMTSHLDEADFHGPELSLAFAVASVRRPLRQLGHRWRR